MDATDPEPSELATLEIGLRGTLVVGRLEGEVDLSNAAALEARILAALRGASALVLDLADVTYLDSAALALLSRVQLACRGSGIGLACVLRDGSRTSRTLELAGVRARRHEAGSIDRGSRGAADRFGSRMTAETRVLSEGYLSRDETGSARRSGSHARAECWS